MIVINDSYATTSFILLKGSWLEEAGFTIDTPVSVTVQKQRLVIEPRSEV